MEDACCFTPTALALEREGLRLAGVPEKNQGRWGLMSRLLLGISGVTQSKHQDHLVFPPPALAQLPDIFTLETARMLPVSVFLSHTLAGPRT